MQVPFNRRKSGEPIHANAKSFSTIPFTKVQQLNDLSRRSTGLSVARLHVETVPPVRCENEEVRIRARKLVASVASVCWGASRRHKIQVKSRSCSQI